MLSKLIALFATGAPGLLRLVFATSLGILFGAEQTVPVLTDFALVVGLSMIFSQGFSLLLLKEGKESEQQSAIVASYVIALPVLLLLFLFSHVGFIHNSLPSMLFFIGLIGYQNIRHMLIKQKKFLKISILECCVILVFLIVLVFAYMRESLSSYGIYLVFSCLFLALSLFQLVTFFSGKLKLNDLKVLSLQALFIGASNFLTGGVIWIMPKASEYLFQPQQIAIITNLSFLLGLIALLPRTFLNLSISYLNDAVEQRKGDIIKRKSSQLNLFLFALFPGVCLLTMLYTYIALDDFTTIWQMTLLIVVFASLVLLISQRNLITSMVITFLHKNEYTFKYNCVYFGLLCLAFISLFFIKHLVGSSSLYVFGFYSMMLLSICVRNYLLERKMWQEFKAK